MQRNIRINLDITEGIKGTELADNAEFALIPEARGLGKKCLQDWAKNKADAKEDLPKKNNLRQNSKKVTWGTTFGKVAAEEKCYIENGRLLRPFYYVYQQKSGNKA